MQDGYRYDIFISYRRSQVVRDWVHNHLLGELRAWLTESMPRDPSIFVDEEIEVGDHWPTALEQALLRSRCMVCVWSPPYFRSRWCMAEWKTMEARLDHLRMAGGTELPRLVYPLRFHDGDLFPPEAKDTQWRDVTRYTDYRPSYRETAGYRAFMEEVKAMAGDLATILAAAPPWESSWPVVRPEPLDALDISQPRLA